MSFPIVPAIFSPDSGQDGGCPSHGQEGGCPSLGPLEPFFCTCVEGPSFTGDRVVHSPATLLQQIARDRDDPRNGDKNGVALIMPSTFHTQRTIHQDLPNGSEMVLYCGIADLDAEPHTAGSKMALKETMKKAFEGGTSIREVCDMCPDFENVINAAQMMCAKLCEKGFAPTCWFTGGKGVRVAWFDPACYMRYRKGDKNVSTRIRDIFFKDYLGADCLARIRELCEFDKCVYDAGKGVKSDLRQHQDTKFWPFLMDFGDADEGFLRMCAK